MKIENQFELGQEVQGEGGSRRAVGSAGKLALQFSTWAALIV